MRRALLILIGLLIPGIVIAGLSVTATVLRSYPTEAVNVAPACSQTAAALSVASASPPALWVHPVSTQPFLIEPGANASLVGQWGIYGAGAITNLCQRSSFESWDDANTPTGWTETETAGDGSAAVSEETTIVAHGGSSGKMVLTGTTSEAKATGDACLTTGIAGDLFVTAWAKKAAGTTRFSIGVVQYDVNDCTTWLETDYVEANTNITTSHAKYGGLQAAAAWHVNTSSYKIVISEACDGGCTTYFDGVQVRVASTPTDALCSTDAAASAVCNLQDITDDNPPFDMTAGGWTFEATVRSPIDGAVTLPPRDILNVPGTAGNNNRIRVYWEADVFYCKVFDSGGVVKTSNIAAAGNADTSYNVKCSKSNVGVVTACWDGACDATPATGALTDGIGAEMVFGTAGAGWDTWVYNPKLSRGAK